MSVAPSRGTDSSNLKYWSNGESPMASEKRRSEFSTQIAFDSQSMTRHIRLDDTLKLLHQAKKKQNCMPFLITLFPQTTMASNAA